MKQYSVLLLLLVPTLIAAESRTTLANLYVKAEKKYALPKGLLAAIGKVESNNNHKAFTKEDGRSRRSSFGVLQIQLNTARQMGFKGKAKELLKPEVNIEYGAAYVRWLMHKTHNNVAQTLTCYNAGASHRLCKTKHYTPYVGLILNALMEGRN